jgi:hypothetical protein
MAREVGQPIAFVPYSGVAETGYAKVDFISRTITWKWNTIDWFNIFTEEGPPEIKYLHTEVERF